MMWTYQRRTKRWTARPVFDMVRSQRLSMCCGLFTFFFPSSSPTTVLLPLPLPLYQLVWVRVSIYFLRPSTFFQCPTSLPPHPPPPPNSGAHDTPTEHILHTPPPLPIQDTKKGGGGGGRKEDS
eukprot:Sspe_Gene.18529::Locus_6657_Transcript_1_1_Confidence_1.000_Length_1724::g.18529::m.18529